VKSSVIEQTIPSEETGTASRKTHEYINQGKGSLKQNKTKNESSKQQKTLGLIRANLDGF
jgi:hypothetical protein